MDGLVVGVRVSAVAMGLPGVGGAGVEVNTALTVVLVTRGLGTNVGVAVTMVGLATVVAVRSTAGAV